MTIPSVFQVGGIMWYIFKQNTNLLNLVCFFKYGSMAILRMMKGSLRTKYLYRAMLMINCPSRITKTV